MLKCPECGRFGGPFRLRHQIQADSQIIRAWGCPCSHTFHATAGSERPSASLGAYGGFTIEWTHRAQVVKLQRISKHETVWSMDRWEIIVNGPPNGPGTRFITLVGASGEQVGEWRLEPGWGPVEVLRRVKVRPLPPEVDPELLARVLVRLLS